jgi:hypothetical protein
VATKSIRTSGSGKATQSKGWMSQQKPVIWSILSAFGGAALLFVGQVSIEEYRSSRNAQNKAEERQFQAEQQRTQLLTELFEEYQSLGEVGDKAAEFIESGQNGSRSDVLTVVRHFRKMTAFVVSDRLDSEAVSQIYGGRLQFWGDQLRRLGSGQSPVSNQFSASNRRNYLLLGEALEHLTHPSGVSANSAQQNYSINHAAPRLEEISLAAEREAHDAEIPGATPSRPPGREAGSLVVNQSPLPHQRPPTPSQAARPESQAAPQSVEPPRTSISHTAPPDPLRESERNASYATRPENDPQARRDILSTTPTLRDAAPDPE